jgi:hypothetical protein
VPLAHLFLRARQRARVARLLVAVLGRPDSHDWIRGARAAALQDALRVGVSEDLSLA